MDFRPLGDGMSCVAVAMPHAALEEGTTDAAPELRRICAVVGGGHDGTKKEARLQIGCLSLQTTMLARLSGESRIRRECAARRGGGRAGDESACVYGKEGWDEAYQSRPAAGKRLKVRRRRVKWCRCFNTATLPRWRLSAQAASSWCTQQRTCSPDRAPWPAYNTCPFTTTPWRRRRIAARGAAKLQG